METADYKNTLKYLNVVGRKVANAIQRSIHAHRLIDTGAMLKSVDYRIIFTPKTFAVEWYLGSGKINFTERPTDPATYGFYLDQGTKYIEPYYFYTDPIKEGTRNFATEVKEEIKKDVAIWARKQVQDAFGK